MQSEKLSRRVLYPAGHGIIMTFTEGQLVNVGGVRCEISAITEFTLPNKSIYTEVEVKLPTGPVFVWKKICDSGVVTEYKIDSLL